MRGVDTGHAPAHVRRDRRRARLSPEPDQIESELSGVKLHLEEVLDKEGDAAGHRQTLLLEDAESLRWLPRVDHRELAPAGQNRSQDRLVARDVEERDREEGTLLRSLSTSAASE